MSGLTVGITGYARAGKNTVAERLVAKHGYKMFSLADGVRDALLALNPWIVWEAHDASSAPPETQAERLQALVSQHGWEDIKTNAVLNADVRELLQRMGTDVGRAIDPDIWVKILEKRINEAEPFAQHCPNIAVPDVRFLNEAENCYHVIRVHRPGIGPANDHVSETEVDQITPHDVIVNDGTIDDLNAKVDAIAKGIF